MSVPNSVIFVREQDAQLSGSGCCGRLEGDFVTCRSGRVFEERRAAMEAMGPVYRAVRARFGDSVAIDVVDPRNTLAIWLLLARDFRRFRVGWRGALATVRGLATRAVVVNGRLAARGDWPEPATLIGLLERIGGGAATPHAAGRAEAIR